MTYQRFDGNATGDLLIVPAHILTPTEAVGERTAQSTLTDLAMQRAPDPSIFESQPPFFFTAQISNSNVDAYSTIMHESSLRNYADEAARGVALQDSHRTDSLLANVGHSLTGAFRGKGGNGLAHVDADFVIRTNDPTGSRDRAIEAIRSGDITDVSIGFHGGLWRCTLCGRDMMDYFGDEYCPHWPGREYPVYDKNGAPTKDRVTAYASIEDAHLAEVSLVYSGATPGAGVVAIKAQRAIEAGRLQPSEVRSLERQFRINLPGAHRAFAGFTPSKEAPVGEVNQQPTAEERATPQTDERAIDERIRAATGAREGEIRAALASVGLSCEGDDLLAAIRTQGAALTELRARADDGKAYRTDLLAEALAEGVRANGEGFAEETYRGILAAAPLDAIKRMRDDWKGIAAKTFPGGRQSSDAGGDGDKGARSQEPDATPASTIDPRMVARFRTPGR